MMNSESFLSLIIFFLFFLYGGSNIYIVTYLRKKSSSVMDLSDFFSTYLGNIKNYKKLNDSFVKTAKENGSSYLFNRIVAIVHLIVPLMIPAVILTVAVWSERHNY